MLACICNTFLVEPCAAPSRARSAGGPCPSARGFPRSARPPRACCLRHRPLPSYLDAGCLTLRSSRVQSVCTSPSMSTSDGSCKSSALTVPWQLLNAYKQTRYWARSGSCHSSGKASVKFSWLARRISSPLLCQPRRVVHRLFHVSGRPPGCRPMSAHALVWGRCAVH